VGDAETSRWPGRSGQAEAAAEQRQQKEAKRQQGQ